MEIAFPRLGNSATVSSLSARILPHVPSCLLWDFYGVGEGNSGICEFFPYFTFRVLGVRNRFFFCWISFSRRGRLTFDVNTLFPSYVISGLF